jgi:hypothetical protein
MSDEEKKNIFQLSRFFLKQKMKQYEIAVRNNVPLGPIQTEVQNFVDNIQFLITQIKQSEVSTNVLDEMNGLYTDLLVLQHSSFSDSSRYSPAFSNKAFSTTPCSNAPLFCDPHDFMSIGANLDKIAETHFSDSNVRDKQKIATHIKNVRDKISKTFNDTLLMNKWADLECGASCGLTRWFYRFMKNKNEQSAISSVEDLKQLQQNFSQDGDVGRRFTEQARAREAQRCVFDGEPASIVKDLK